MTGLGADAQARRWRDIGKAILGVGVRAVAYGAGAAFLAVVLALINPFEFTHWLELRSHQAWESLQAVVYADTSPVGRDAITIVSIDENTLSAMHLKRPLDMVAHGQILGDVIEEAASGAVDPYGLSINPADRPRAVFVDLLLSRAASPEPPSGFIAFDKAYPHVCTDSPKSFLCYVRNVARYTRYDVWGSDPLCQTDTLAKLGCIQRSRGMPILFADESPARRVGEDDSRPAAMRMLERVAVTVPAFIALPDYPLVEHAEGLEPTPGQSITVNHNERIRLSPAASLWAVWCMQASRRGCDHMPFALSPGELTPRPDTDWSATYAGDLEVYWAAGGDQRRRDKHGVLQRTADPFVSGLERRHWGADGPPCESKRGGPSAVWRFVKMIFSGVHLEKPRPDCPYTHQLPYQALFAPGMDQAFIRSALGGKLVLIGDEFSDSADIVNAGANVGLPGVYAHAMALDTLMEKTPAQWRPIRPMTPWLDFNEIDQDIAILTFLYCTTSALLRSTLPETVEIQSRTGTAPRILAAITLLWIPFRFVLAVFVLALLGFGVFRQCLWLFQHSNVVIGILTLEIFVEFFATFLVTSTKLMLPPLYNFVMKLTIHERESAVIFVDRKAAATIAEPPAPAANTGAST